jgi:hypothetical protein
MANRIKLKELSELMAKEVQNGNGDAYVFVGEYYVTSDNYVEKIPSVTHQADGTIVTNTEIKDNGVPYIIYKDETVKEKVMAMTYTHVQKLTDEENIEYEKLLRAEEEKKMGLKSKKSSSSGYTRYGINDYGNNNIYGGYERRAVNEDANMEAPVAAPAPAAQGAIDAYQELLNNRGIR